MEKVYIISRMEYAGEVRQHITVARTLEKAKEIYENWKNSLYGDVLRDAADEDWEEEENDHGEYEKRFWLNFDHYDKWVEIKIEECEVL